MLQYHIRSLTDGILTGGEHTYNAQCKIRTSAPRKPVAENLAEHLADVADVPQRRLAPYMRIRSNEKKIQMGIYILLTCAATLHEQSTFTHRQSQHTTVTHATARSFTARHTHQFIDAIISAILHEHLHMSVCATTNEHNTFAHSPN